MKILCSLWLSLPFWYGCAPDRCTQLKKEPIHVGSEEIQTEILKLTTCGYDSVDCSMAMPLIGTLMLKKTTQQKSVPTFGEAAILIDMMKQDPDYAAKRADFVRRRSKGTRPQERVAVGVDYSVLCDMPLHRDQFTAFAGIPQYFDYDQALRCSRKQGKHLLLYFTSAFSVTSRKMEQDVFTDPAIKKLLTLHFVIANLSVDDDVVNGPENLALLKRFGSENQPTISLCTADGRIINTIGYATREELLEVLQSVL